MQTNPIKRHVNTALWVSALVLVGAGSFFSGKVLYYNDGYLKGASLADSSFYKMGEKEGYNRGYEYCDSIAEDLERAKSSEQFNLNIIYEELGNPKEYIQVVGEMDSKTDNGIKIKYAKVRINNNAAFARYNEVVIKAVFKDKAGTVIGSYMMDVPDVLYPRKSVQIEIPSKEVPALTESVELEVQTAQGMD